RTTMDLEDLIQNHRLLLAPPDMRSRAHMEEMIREWNIPDPRHDVRVAAETYDTTTSIMAVRSEFAATGRISGIIVATSDAARAFKAGMEFGGSGAEDFKWIPIVHQRDGRDLYLHHDVFVTIRSGSNEAIRLRPIIRTLKQTVERMNRASAPHPPRGEPTQPDSVLPPAAPTRSAANPGGVEPDEPM